MSREAVGVEGVSPDSRKRKMAVPDTKAGKYDGKNEGKRASPD